MADQDELKVELQKAFEIFDKTERGFLEYEEFLRLIGFLGLDIATLKVRDFAKNENEISLEALINIISHKLDQDLSHISQKELMFAFSLLDLDKSGHITNKQFAKLLNDLNEKLTSEEVTSIIKLFDIHGRAEVSYEELYDHMMLQIGKKP